MARAGLLYLPALVSRGLTSLALNWEELVRQRWAKLRVHEARNVGKN